MLATALGRRHPCPHGCSASIGSSDGCLQIRNRLWRKDSQAHVHRFTKARFQLSVTIRVTCLPLEQRMKAPDHVGNKPCPNDIIVVLRTGIVELALRAQSTHSSFRYQFVHSCSADNEAPETEGNRGCML
ncbi:hypothetical protein CF319_g7779 [Tilletia indica]|nr:hypothetical protein CF319_g7779 [Tilletia indica]